MNKDLYLSFESAQFWADFSLVDFPDSYLDSMNQPITEALQKMEELENGSIANPDENRMVGHYWLRTPTLAPSKELTDTIQKTLDQLKQISRQVHDGSLQSPSGPFTDLLVVGIGGSALGPQFVGKALGHPKKDKLKVHFLIIQIQMEST